MRLHNVFQVWPFIYQVCLIGRAQNNNGVCLICLNITFRSHIIQQLLMIFRNLLGKVMSRIADLSPVKNLIKYILDRTLNQFLSNQIEIDDFKDVENAKLLLLSNISLNLAKINKQSLLSSPYILHAGTIRQLKIKLPNWSQLASKSIEVTIDGLLLDFKPNKQFAENFKESMKEQQENVIIEQMQQPGEISENNPMDFFRQLVKQMLLNMLIKIENVAVRLFINQPSPDIASKPQYYLMFRIPLLSVGKAEDPPISQENVETVRFDVDLPQLSVHLLREGVKFPEYANEKGSSKDFPFTYPSLAHPGTLLLMGQYSLNNKEAARLRITLTTNYNTHKKEMNVEGRIGSIETIIDPIQLKIFSRFIVQIQQFQKILKSVLIQLGLLQVNQLGASRQSTLDLTLSRNGSNGNKTNALDLFSSMVMSISEPRKGGKSIDLYDNLTAKPELKTAANQFNQEAQKELKKSGESIPTQQGYKNINFKQELKLSFNLGRLQLNLLKYVSPMVCERGWGIGGAGDQVNMSLNSNHFRGDLRELNYNFSTVDSKHLVTMRYVTLHDVRLPNSQSAHLSTDQFFDIDSSTFYNDQTNQDYFINQPQLLPFRLHPQEHFCMEELLRVSDGPCQPIKEKDVRRYAFMPDHSGGNGEGLTLIYNSHKKVLKVDVREVAVMGNFEVWKDVLNIVYPIFLYKQLASKININGQMIQCKEQSQQPVKFNPLESAYVFSGSLLEQVQARERPVGLHVEVGLVYFLYRETEAVKPVQNLISQVQIKAFDYDNFSKGCFCHLTERGLYAQAQGFVFEKQRQNISLQVQQIKTGYLSLKDSVTSQQNIDVFLVVEGLKLMESRPTPTIALTRLFIPKARFCLELPQLINFVDIVKRIIGTVQTLLSFRRCLASKIVSIDLENGRIEKPVKQKVKKERVLQIYAEEISLKTILISTFVRSLYFKKEGSSQQIRLNSLGVGLISKVQTSIGQFRNDLVVTTYPKQEIFPGINNSLLLFQIGRHKLSDSLYGKSENIKKLQFFKTVCSGKYSLELFLRKTSAEYFDKKSQNQKFCFNKNPKKGSKNNSSNVIEQQKYSKNIQICLNCPINLYVGNIAYLIRQKQQIQRIVHRITSVFQQIKRDSKQIMVPERKVSIESIQEEGAEIGVKILKQVQILIDIRPDFSFNEQKNERILSNSRLVVHLNINKMNLSTCSESMQTKFDVTSLLQLHFLHHKDRDLETNPIFVTKQQLKVLGFRSIAKIGEVNVKGDYFKRIQKGGVECKIDNISLGLCVSSIPYIELFAEHLLKHSFEGDFGQNDGQFEVLNQQIEQPQVMQQGKIKQFQTLMQQKRKNQKMFQASEYSVATPKEFKGIIVKKLQISHINVNLYSGNEFNFVECNSLYQSKASARVTVQQPDAANNISLLMQKLSVQAGLGEESRLLIELQRISIDFMFERDQGLVWKQKKSYNVNLLRIERPLKILIHNNKSYLKVKVNHLQLTAAFTDSIFALSQLYSRAAEEIQKSGWKKEYMEFKRQNSNRSLLVILPGGLLENQSFKIVVSAQLKNIKILNDRMLYLKGLTIHEVQGNQGRINQIVNDWVMQILKVNLGTLATGAFTQLISLCVMMLFGAVRHVFAFFLPALRN